MIKTLLASLREYKKPAILTPILVAMEVLMETLIPTIMALIIDNGIMNKDMDSILHYGGILLIMAMISLFCGWANGVTAAKASTGFAKNLRHDMYYKIQDYSFANIDKFSTGSLVTRITTDVTNVQMAFQMCTRIAVRAPLMFIMSLIMAVRISPSLSLVFLVAFPILAICIGLIIKTVFPLFKKVFEGYDKLNTTIQENLNGIRVVKSFVREDHEINKFSEDVNYIFKNNSLASRIMNLSMPLMSVVMYACILFISYKGSEMVIFGGLTTGQLTALITYVNQILMSFMMVSMVIMMITMSQADAARIVEVLKEESTITAPQQAVDSVKDGSIDFNHVSFKYSPSDEANALTDIDIHIKSGETIGVIGGTGSGKTSFVSLIPRLYDISEGELLVGGVNVKDYDLTALRDKVAMVLQKNTLFSGTIKENLRWGNANASDDQIKHVASIACADEFIDKMPDGYNTYIEQGGSNVSGGQKQRLCLARALLKNPRILILDDSTSAVDTHTDALIRQSFASEIPDVTKIIIAQRISSVEHCDRIIVLDKGMINGVGTHDELLKTNEIYRQVYESQQKGGSDDEQY